MLLLLFATTFLAVALAITALWQRLQVRRRVQSVLRDRDPLEQRATVLRKASPLQRWEEAAQQAGVAWTARSYVTLAAGGALAAGVMALAGAGLLGLLLLLLAILGPWLVVHHRRHVRADQFAAQLPGALTLAANTLRSGGTLLQAVRAIARQMEDPIRSEFVRVEQALQLQVPLATALQQTARRIGAREFTAVVIACKVAGQAGADLDLVLENIAREIVEEKQFREAMWAASSEGRMAAKVVTAIPFVVGGFFLINDPAYFDPMLDSGSGRLLLIGSFAAIVLGWLSIRKITDARNW